MNVEQIVLSKLRALPEQEQEKVLDYLATLEATAHKPPRVSSYGLWAGIGEAITEQEIDDARAELWREFPREGY